MLPPLALVALAARPPIAQQITWFYSTSLANGADFLASVIGLDEVENTKQVDTCRIFHSAPGHYFGVCDSRPPPHCPRGPESADAPPVTYTFVVESRVEVEAWHEHLLATGGNRTIVKPPRHSTKLASYAFNFYDADSETGLGCYRFEVQSFEDPAWPVPACAPIQRTQPQLQPSFALPPRTVVEEAVLTPVGAGTAAAPLPSKPRVMLDLFVASKCPDAPRCQRMLAPVLESGVGELVEVRLGFLANANASEPSGFECLHGPTECVGNLAELCVHAHWPYHVDIEVGQLPAHLNWMLFLPCVSEGANGRPFNSTASSLIPGNTNACLQRYGVPSATADAIEACVAGDQGKALLAESAARTHAMCGTHSDLPHIGCKSCSMYLDGQPVCVIDDATIYNCSAVDQGDSSAWTAAICAAAKAKGYPEAQLPLVCRLAARHSTTTPSSPRWPTVHGHSYASVDPKASADFAVKYFGAALVKDEQPVCMPGIVGGLRGESGVPPREVVVRLPLHSDFRGGGLELRFVSNPRKAGGAYDIAAHVDAMARLYGNLSDNSGHHWNQFFDNHLGFYAHPSDQIATALLRDGVPFFTGQSGGLYQSVYVVIPGTGQVVEVLGNFMIDVLPRHHVRFSSTDQFCSPKRLRRRLGESNSGIHGGGGSSSSSSSSSSSLGINYKNGDADLNKTTMAGADPEAAIAFAVRYLGGSPIQQHRGPQGDGPCTKLAWAEWPDLHQWHVVKYSSADWVTTDQLRPAVPYNISDLAKYVEELRALGSNVYDMWLDNREVLQVGNLTEMAEVLQADGVPFGVWSQPAEGTCSIYLDLPGNGLAVELVSREFGGEPLRSRCVSSRFDLCAAA